MRSPAEYRSDLDGTHSPPPVSVTAEFDEIATGERTPGLLQAATRRETAEIDRREAETLDELFDECGRFGMVPRDEDHATSSVLNRLSLAKTSSDSLRSTEIRHSVHGPKTPSLVGGKATGIVRPSALHGHTGVAMEGGKRAGWAAELDL